jgi:hypothetical protein
VDKVLIVAVGVLVAVSACSPTAALSALADDTTCTLDSDCCMAVDACNGTAVAVDFNHAQEASALTISARNQASACVRCVVQPLQPVCIEQRCVLVDPASVEQPLDVVEVAENVTCAASQLVTRPPDDVDDVDDVDNRSTCGD